MSKFQSFLQFDDSSLANYKNWGWGASSSVYGIHQALEQLGFSQTSDQGQVVWNSITATITATVSTTSVATYTYTTLSPADPITTNRTLRAGMLINAITGTTNGSGAFNIAAPGNVLVLSVTPVTSTTGSFTTAFAGGAFGSQAETGAFSIPGISFPAAWTTETLNVAGATNNVNYNNTTNAGYVSTYTGYYNGTPASYSVGNVLTFASTATNPNNYLVISTAGIVAPTTAVNQTNYRFYNYEMWQSNDGISPTYYFKIEYANNGSVTSNTPLIGFTMGTATTGALVTGSNFGGGSLQYVPSNTLSNRVYIAPTSATTAGGASTFECDFFGSGTNGGSFAFLLWRNGAANNPMFFGVERSLDTSGTYVGTYMTFVKGNGPGTTTGNWTCAPVLPNGTNPGVGSITDFVPTVCLPDATAYFPGNANTYQVGQNIAALPCFPLVGYVGNPFFNLLSMKANDAVEGGTFTATVYGSTHTYLMTKTAFANYFGTGVTLFGNGAAFALRWE